MIVLRRKKKTQEKLWKRETMNEGKRLEKEKGMEIQSGHYCVIFRRACKMISAMMLSRKPHVN